MLFGSLVFSDKCERFIMLPCSSSQLLNRHYLTYFPSFSIKLTIALCNSHRGPCSVDILYKSGNLLYVCIFLHVICLYFAANYLMYQLCSINKYSLWVSGRAYIDYISWGMDGEQAWCILGTG